MEEPLNLNDIEERLNAISPYPWRSHYHVDFPYEPGYLVYLPPLDGGTFGSEGDLGWMINRKDAEFVALAPSYVAALVNEVHRLRKLLDKDNA